MDIFELGTLVGREHEDFILAPGGTMSIWGIAGVGKSAVVKETYHMLRYHSRERCASVRTPSLNQVILKKIVNSSFG
jgi:hypothetical protein